MVKTNYPYLICTSLGRVLGKYKTYDEARCLINRLSSHGCSLLVGAYIVEMGKQQWK